VQKNSMILIVGDEEPVREGTMDQIKATRCFIAEVFGHAGDFLKIQTPSLHVLPGPRREGVFIHAHKL
jgi:hypothetical protein